MTTIYYLGVRFSRETNQKLLAYRFGNNLDHLTLPKLGFHTTIVHSKTHFTYRVGSLPKEPIGYVGEYLQLWGTSLVLSYNITNNYLRDMFDEVILQGATSDYTSYTPHITIAENCDYVPKHIPTSIPIIVSGVFYMEWAYRLEVAGASQRDG